MSVSLKERPSQVQNQEQSGRINYNEIPKKLRRRPYYIIAPGLLILIGILIPFFAAICLSFTNYSFKMTTFRFVGLKNWINILKDSAFYHSLLVTLQYAFCATLTEMLLGTGIALLLKKDTKFSRVLKVLLTFPLMVAPAIAVLIWQLMTSNSIGILEKVLNVFGVFNFPWAASHSTALFTAVLIDTWVNTPFVLLLVLAGIQSLPKSPFEAAPCWAAPLCGTTTIPPWGDGNAAENGACCAAGWDAAGWPGADWGAADGAAGFCGFQPPAAGEPQEGHPPTK